MIYRRVKPNDNDDVVDIHQWLYFPKVELSYIGFFFISGNSRNFLENMTICKKSHIYHIFTRQIFCKWKFSKYEYLRYDNISLFSEIWQFSFFCIFEMLGFILHFPLSKISALGNCHTYLKNDNFLKKFSNMTISNN